MTKEDKTVASDSKPAKKSRKPKAESSDAPKVKKPMTGYMNFVKTVRPKIAAENPEMKFAEIGKEMGAQWKALSQAEKDSYKPAEWSSGSILSYIYYTNRKAAELYLNFMWIVLVEIDFEI